MRLSDLEKYSSITIQCHDNPDADALGAGYGLYCYFQSKGKQVKLIYSGANRVQKSNLCLMIDELKLPVEYVEPAASAQKLKGLLITVDCQYGAGNVTRFWADEVAVIDHHQQEIDNVPLSLIRPNLGSCCTLVWKLLLDEGYVVDDERGLGTALYYGLYMDTKQFSELFNPLDRDMRDSLPHEKSLMTLFINSNLSLQELEIAGLALLRYSYNDDYDFAVIKAKPCDPNILGIISDFLLQVDVIKTCVVFNEVEDGYKFSVRSCIKEVNASELAEYLAEGIGSGGGHYEKAGGFISLRLYEEQHPTLHAEGYFNNRMVEYFDGYQPVYASEYTADTTGMRSYEKKDLPLGYVEADNLFPVGTPIIIRTARGDMELAVWDDLYLVIGHKGEVRILHRGEFEHAYNIQNEKFCMEDCEIQPEYAPVIRNKNTGQNLVLTEYTLKCLPIKKERIYAKPLERGMKLFTLWERDRYMTGNPGDYLAVRMNNPKDIFIIPQAAFALSYDEIERKDIDER